MKTQVKNALWAVLSILSLLAASIGLRKLFDFALSVDCIYSIIDAFPVIGWIVYFLLSLAACILIVYLSAYLFFEKLVSCDLAYYGVGLFELILCLYTFRELFCIFNSYYL